MLWTELVHSFSFFSSWRNELLKFHWIQIELFRIRSKRNPFIYIHNHTHNEGSVQILKLYSIVIAKWNKSRIKKRFFPIKLSTCAMINLSYSFVQPMEEAKFRILLWKRFSRNCVFHHFQHFSFTLNSIHSRVVDGMAAVTSYRSSMHRLLYTHIHHTHKANDY